MKSAFEFLVNALRFGGAVAEAVREARRKGDTRKAGEIWRQIESKRIADEAARKRREAFAREAARHGADFGERDE